MVKPKYFFGIEVVYKKHRPVLFQRKYVLALFEGTGLLGCKLASTLIESNWTSG